jgi:hypothetical protein
MGGRLLPQRAKCPLVPVDGAAEAQREPRVCLGGPGALPRHKEMNSASSSTRRNSRKS